MRTAAVTHISPILLEKDFWVSFLLGRIFELDVSCHLTFKGGTSLSKCYGLIHRFSEDCDITINKSLFTGAVNADVLSEKQFQKMLEQNDKKAIIFVHDTLKPKLEEAIKHYLPHEDQWQIMIDEDEPKNLRFMYPASIKADSNFYIKQSVLLEMGVRGDISPSETKKVTSYIEQHFHDLLDVSQTMVRVLSPIRTFWEKITLLHAEYHRPQEKQVGDRLSRHYYDIYQMIHAGIHRQALRDINVLHEVITNKKRYFRSSWAKYDEAVPGTLRIYPNDHLLEYLKNDYKKMEVMIFSEISAFDRIMETIKDFETEINTSSFIF